MHNAAAINLMAAIQFDGLSADSRGFCDLGLCGIVEFGVVVTAVYLGY